jgi:hypothetical protein
MAFNLFRIDDLKGATGSSITGSAATQRSLLPLARQPTLLALANAILAHQKSYS